MTDLQPTELEECDECQGKGYYLIDGIPQVCICVGELEDGDLYHCPLCNTEVDVGNYYDWGDGECPTCGNKWSWQETLYYEGYHVVDTCPFVEWEKYSRK